MSENTMDRIRSLNPIPSDLPALPIETVLARVHETPPLRASSWRSRLQQSRSGLVIAASTMVVIAVVVGVIVAVSGHQDRGDRGATEPQPPAQTTTIPSSIRELAEHFALLRAAPVRIPPRVAQSFGGGASTERAEGHRVVRPAGVVWVAPDDALGLCLALEQPGKPEPAGSGCADQSEAERVGVRLSASSRGREWIAGVVPDGITAVRLRPAGAAAITVPVVDNVYAYSFRAAAAKGGARYSLTDIGPPSPSARTTTRPTAAEVRPLTSILGVLRRSQIPADRNAALTEYLRRQDRNSVIVGNFGRPVLSLMRLATVTPWAQRVYVVPFLPPTAAEKSRVPPNDRAGNAATTVTLHTFSMSGSTVVDFFGDGYSAALINGGRVIGNGAYDTSVYDHPRQVIMVVPDGVAKVALWQPTGSIANHPKHPTAPGSQPVVATVRDNIAAFIAPSRFERPHQESFSRAGQEIWYGPGDNVVKRIDNANSCGPPLGGCS